MKKICRECSTEYHSNLWGTMRNVCGPCYLIYKKEIREGKRNRYGKVI